ncbi:hypothetical protein HK405_003407 [Cladochytrium tenue]|nr:hypothetical protein HK405_003407 [Cladochytrium tenue]
MTSPHRPHRHRTVVLAAVAAAVLLLLRRRAAAAAVVAANTRNLSVLVTGCDSGFGRTIAVSLAARGFHVFAGCLTDAGVTDLQNVDVAPGSLDAFIMDVTNSEHVAAARDRVQRACPNGLYCLINNAGVHSAYNWELTPMDLIKRDMDYFGTVQVCKEFLPLLRAFAASTSAADASAARPRIVTIASIAGTLKATPLGSYMASKHAVMAFSATLRQEIQEQGILYSSIEPYYCNTPMVTYVSPAKIDRIISTNSKTVLDVYGGDAYLRKKLAVNAMHTRFDFHLKPYPV